VAGPLLAALLFGIGVVLAMPVPYRALSPGQARSVEPLVEVSQRGDGPVPEADAVDDDLLFVTVSVSSGRPPGLQALLKLLDDTNEVLPEDLITGGQSPQENRRFNLQLMTDSKDKATKVALERAGYEVEVKTNGAVVVDLDPTYPVAAVVQPGDTIVEAEGQPIDTSEDLVDVIAAGEPGDVVRLGVESFATGERRDAEVALATNPETGAAQLGVSLDDRPEYEFPITVDIDSGEVGGPSAGLAFTLAILDRLTPGSLTGDARVAVTGTIGLDGSVGPVGGVLQKTEAAVDAGARVFLVPPDEYQGAVEAARGRLEVRRVASLDDALAALLELGGEPVPEVPAGGSGSGG
jgi:PDZ domain-containing protein